MAADPRHLVQPDAVPVADDLFDNQRVSDCFVQRVLARLGSLGVPCIVIDLR